jgi:hypothetical protein
VKLLDAGGSHDPAVARAIHAHLREQFIAQQAREVYGDARPMPSRERILRPLRRWAIRHEAGLIVAAIFGAALVIGLVVPW